MLAKVLIAFGIAAVPFSLMFGGSAPPSEPSPVVTVDAQPELVRRSVESIQPPASVPCACCGTNIPGTLYLTGTDSAGHTYNRLPLYHHNTHPDGALKFVGSEPATFGANTFSANVVFYVGLAPVRPTTPITARLSQLEISYAAPNVWTFGPQGGIAAGLFDCTTTSFTTQPPVPTTSLPAGMIVSP